MIEAAAGRNASDAETRIALQRLELAREQVPYSLESAQLEREARDDIEQELRASARRLPGKDEVH
jgi:hypothetical protein